MDAFGTKLGRIHMTKQNLDSLQTRKMKGLKRKSDEGAEDEEEDVSADKQAREDMDTD